MTSKARSSCYSATFLLWSQGTASTLSHRELLEPSMDSEEHWLCGRPRLPGPGETWLHLTFNHGVSPGMLLFLRRCQRGIYFRNMLSQKSVPGLKWPQRHLLGIGWARQVSPGRCGQARAVRNGCSRCQANTPHDLASLVPWGLLGCLKRLRVLGCRLPNQLPIVRLEGVWTARGTPGRGA